jgi:hypothetical protein
MPPYMRAKSMESLFGDGAWICGAMVNLLNVARDSRIIVAPSEEKKEIQRKINIRLSAIRTHPSVFGFAKGKSALDCATAHTDFHGGKMELLIKMDIKNFFNSFSEKMIIDGLSHHGFNEEEQNSIIQNCMMEVSHESPLVKLIIQELFKSCYHTSDRRQIDAIELISSALLLLSNVEDREMVTDKMINESLNKHRFDSCEWTDNEPSQGELVKAVFQRILKCGPETGFGNKMLFQGGPSSPVLSNICFKGMDYRLAAYVKACGGFYTRYADDLCLSFGERKTTKNINLFIYAISKMVKEGGFIINPAKTSVAGSGGQQKIVGYCVNSGVPTIPQGYRKLVYREIAALRDENLGAIQKTERVSKIEGMIAYVETASPGAAVKLTTLLESTKNKQPTNRKIEI